MRVTRLAPAKINLALHVTGQRADGYHELDTLVVFTELGDRITISEGSSDDTPVSLVSTGPFAEQLDMANDNLVVQAAQLLIDRIGEVPHPVELTLEKNLPVASGIGGGSADAAAALLALSELWKFGDSADLGEIALKLGADVPMCLVSKPLRARGIGEIISTMEVFSPLNLLLVNPGVSVSTPDVFKQLENKPNSLIEMSREGVLPNLAELGNLRNDLQEPAISVAPVIAEVLTELNSIDGCQLARMSGSGATCFGVFD